MRAGRSRDGEIEVDDLGFVGAADEDVFRFEIEMEEAAFVDVGETGGETGEEAHLVGAQLRIAAQDGFLEVRAVHVFENAVRA